MNMKVQLLKNTFINTLVALAEMSTADFSGAGFILYNDITQLSKYHCNLVNDGKNIQSLKIGTKAILDYLSIISKYQHPYHDGFHFINGEGELTHVAQFIAPPINRNLPNTPGHGARTFCSLSASCIPGVQMIGSISSNQSIYLFEKGQLVNSHFLYQAA